MGILDQYVGSGLWDGGRAVFRNPQFTRLPDYRDGQVVLFTADLYLPDEDGQVLEGQRFSMGNGWIASDDGTEITGHEDGKKLKLNDSTGLGLFVNSLGTMDALDEVLAARVKAGEPGTTPFHVALYDGLDVTMEQHSREFTTSTDEKATQRYYVVTEFHGYEGAGDSKPKAAKQTAKKATKAVAKKAASKPAAPVVEDNPTDAEELDQAVVDAITAVATEANDYDEFVANCYADVAAVAEDERYQQLVEDQSDEGIWAQVVAAWEAENGA